VLQDVPDDVRYFALIDDAGTCRVHGVECWASEPYASLATVRRLAALMAAHVGCAGVGLERAWWNPGGGTVRLLLLPLPPMGPRP
jgi:hypothetical protein